MHFINEFVSSLEPNVWVVHILQYYFVFKNMNMNKGFDLLQIQRWKEVLELVFLNGIIALARAAAAALQFLIQCFTLSLYEKWEDNIDNIVGDVCTILLLFGSAKKSSSQKQT